MTLIDCNDEAQLKMVCTPDELRLFSQLKEYTMQLGLWLSKRGYHSFEWRNGDLVVHQGRPDFKLIYDEKYRSEYIARTMTYKEFINTIPSVKGVIVDIEKRKIDYDFESVAQ